MPRTFSRDTLLGQRMDLLGYTVFDVAAGAGVDRWSINDYLNHGKAITPRDMMRLCTFLECEPEALTG